METTTRTWSPANTFAAFMGVAGLFMYYRSATFMGGIFSLAPANDFSGGWLISPVMPMVVLAFSIALLVRGSLPRLFSNIPAAAIAGVFGAGIALLARIEALPGAAAVLGAIPCAYSFVCSVLMSGRTLCSMSIARMAGTVVTAYLAAFCVFVVIRQTPAVQVCALLTPVFATVSWAFCPRAPHPDHWAPNDIRASLTPPLLWMLLLVLTSSAAVRSLLGEGGLPSTFRTLTCAGSSILLIAAWGIGVLAGRKRPTNSATAVPVALGVGGVLLGTVFLAAVFPYLAQGNSDGIYLAASVRAALDALWLATVCMTTASRCLPQAPAFLIWGSSVWSLQWLLCYWALPAVLFGGSVVSPQTVVTAAVLLLTFSLFAICGILLFRSKTSFGPRHQPNLARNEGPDVYTLLEARGLTEREAQVAVLFAQGLSIGGVASRLGIKKNTAQSHSKSIYRKLDIHTKDELIDIVQGGARPARHSQ